MLYQTWQTQSVLTKSYRSLNILQDLSDETQGKIAAEMNLSETAFIRTLSPGDGYDKGKE